MAFRARAAALAAAMLAAAGAVQAVEPRSPAEVRKGYEQTPARVAPGVHVLHQAEPFQPAPVGNVTVIEQSDGLVLVDSGGDRGSGERIVALVRSISAKPVKAVVLTHWHNDHPLGLSAVKAAWPAASVIATRRTAEHMRAGRLRTIPFAPDPVWDKARVKLMQDAAAEYAAAADKPGITPQERAGWRELSIVAAIGAEDEPGTHVVLPDVVFDDRHLIDDALSPVEVAFVGRANTDGDAVVWVPRRRVLVAGDAVVSPVPYGFNVFPKEWVAVLERLKAYDFAVLVPGHGLPQTDRAYLDRLAWSMEDIRARIAPLAARGLSVEQAKAELDLEAHRAAFAGSDPWRRYFVQQYWLDPFIASAHREAKGEPLGPPPLAPAS